MKSEIYVIVHQPLSYYTFDRFGLNQNLNNKITYLNILPLIDFKTFQSYENSNFRNDNFLNFKSYSSLLDFLMKNKNNFFYINLTGKNLTSTLIEIFFSLYGGVKFEIIQPSLPLLSKQKKNLKRIFNTSKILLYYKFRNKIRDTLQSFFYSLICKKPKISFVSNNIYFDKLNKSKLTFKINHLDYYNFHKDNKKDENQEYFCFVDQEQENSFENKLYFKSTYIPGYLARISKLLKTIENKTGLSAKIALHHRKKSIPKEFENFHCLSNNTIEIIKNSKFILSHNSTALNFAIMSKKPIILIWLEEFNSRLSKYSTMKKLEYEIDCRIINEKDNLDDIDFQKKIDDFKYNKFIENYINFNEKIALEHPWKTIDIELSRL